MASKEQKIASALNSAINSNILQIASVNNVRELIEDYLFNSDEEEDYEEEEAEELEEVEAAEGASTSTSTESSPSATPTTSRSTGTATPPPCLLPISSDEDDGDADLVVVSSQAVAEVNVQEVGEKDQELEKVRAYSCGCKLKSPEGLTGCLRQFTEDEIFNKRLDMGALTNDEKDFYVMGLLNAFGPTQSETTLHKRHSRRVERKLPRRAYTIDGKPVCREAFRFLLCMGQGRLVALQRSPLEARRKPLLGGRRYNTRALTANDVQHVVKFIESFTEDHGLCLPGRIPGYKRADLKLLPSYYTKSRLWRTYKQITSDQGRRVVGLTSFKTLWKEHLPYIVVARPMTDLCNICQTNNSIILRGANIGDPNKLLLLERQKHHLHLVNVEREFYNSVVQDCKATAAALGITELTQNEPNSRQIAMGYCFDFAQQVHLPSSPMQPGPIYFLTPRKCGVFGVCCPAIPQQVNFLIDESMCCGKGSNAVISYLHFFFETFGLGETEAVLHCDNCSGQNKNNYMLWYLMWRVLHGYHEKISLNFMVPGHTKFAPDWCFGLLKQNFRRMEVHSMHDMCRAVAESLNKAQLVGLEDGITALVPSYDWQAFLGPYFKPLKGIKSLFHFKFDHGTPNVIARSSIGEESVYQVLKNPSNLPPVELPEPIPPPGLPPIRRKYLFDNIRQFVRDDCKDILCPE